MRYIVVSSVSSGMAVKDLERKVNDKLKEGYKLVGGLAVTGDWSPCFYQAMTKEEE